MPHKHAVKKKFENLIAQSKQPIAVFDLDGTLFDVSYRTLEIVRRFIRQEGDHSVAERFARETALVKNLEISQVKYSLEQTLNSLGITRDSENSAHFLHLAETYWFKHFFTDELVLADQIYEGGVQCVKWFFERGVRIVYLSGRDIPNMSKGTITALENFGFPHRGHNISVILKPAYGQDDLLFKKQAMDTIRSEGDVITTFDNEPANVKMFLEEFPHAISFHFNSPYARWIDLTGDHYRQIDRYADLDLT